jgi:hypothetical protein
MNPNAPPNTGMPPLDLRAQFSMFLADLAAQLERRNYDPVEMVTRRSLAGVPIMPPPIWSVQLVAPGANSMYQLDIPDTVSIMTFSALATVDYHVNFGGKVTMPRVQNANLSSGTFTLNDGIACPSGNFYYTRNQRTVWVGIAAATAVVTVTGWQQI